jgi:hypothetical protein
MKFKFFILFLLFSLSVCGQTTEKTIQLLDSETNLPIEDATVYISNLKQTLLSNSEGKVAFVLKSTSSIQITHPSYKKMNIKSSVLKENVNKIFLTSSLNNLDEIIITKQHPQNILIKLVQNSINKLTVPARLKVYTREFFNKDNVDTYYNDGLLNFQLEGKNKNFKNTILVEQNRSFGLLNLDIGNDALGYNLNNIMENYYSFKYLDPILDSSAKKKFNFIIKGNVDTPNYYKMEVTYLNETNEKLDDFVILYDHSKKLIIEVSAIVSPTTFANAKEKVFNKGKNIYKSSFKTIYRIENSNYYLISSKEEIGFEKMDKGKNYNFEVRNYFVTTNFSTQIYTFKENAIFKGKTLYNKKNVIFTPFWEQSGLIPTEEDRAIIEYMRVMTN